MRGVIFIIFIIAISTLALFSSTDIVTLFNGTHTINSLTSDVNDVECTGCHQRMRDQLDNSSIHSTFECEECHRLAKTAGGKVIKYATHNNSGITIGNESHAAYTPRCLDCHGDNGVYYNNSGVQKQAPTAIAFNESDYGSDYSAHKPFVEQALNWGLSKGENEACIACHTNYSMELNFKRPEWFQFYVDPKKSYLIVSSISYGPTNTTVIQKPCNGAKHEFVDVNMDGIRCESCHSDIWRAANHTVESEIDTYDSTNASHVLWQFEGNILADSPMHNATCVYSEYGVPCNYEGGYTAPNYYDNITQYCTLSCHRPVLDESQSTTVPAVFSATTHAAKRVSCYNCHDEYYDYNLYFWNQPLQQNSTAVTRHYTGASSDYSDEIYDNAPLFMHAETCITCKRDDLVRSGTYKTWTEPNNTMYDTDGYYI